MYIDIVKKLFMSAFKENHVFDVDWWTLQIGGFSPCKRELQTFCQ